MYFSWFQLQNESALTLACIEKCRDSGFEEVFMTRIDYPVKYDHVIRYNFFLYFLSLLQWSCVHIEHGLCSFLSWSCFCPFCLHVCSLRLNLKGKSSVYASGFCLDDECWRLYEQKVHNVLSQGLSDRVKTVRVTWKSMLSESILQNVWHQVFNFSISSQLYIFLSTQFV